MACDINKDCRDTYEKNYGIKPLGDIQTIEDIPDYDILCAGIPCQAYSNIGQHKGFDDDRGKLFFDVLKFIQTKDPKVVIIENVRGLVSHNNGESLKFIIDEITKLGFTCNYKVLACNDYGIPQMRKRLFIVFFKNSIPGIEHVFDFPLCETPSLSEFLDKSLVKKIAYTIRCGGRMSPIDDKHNWDGYRMLDDEKYARVSLRLKKTSERNKALTYGLNLNTTLTDKTDFLLWEDATQGALKQSDSTAMPFRGTSVTIDPFFAYGGAGKVEHRVNMRLMSNLNRLPDNANNNSDSYSLFSEYQFSSGRRGVFAMVAGASQQYINIGSNFYGDHWGWNVAGYAQFEASPLSWLRGVAGVRLEQYILDGEAEKLIPIFRAGLNATLAEATFLRASIGQGYRYPAVAEKHAYTTVGSIKILPNFELKPESGWSSEIGLKQGFSVYSLSGQADIALFYSENQNLIEFVFGYWYDIKADEFTYGFNPTNIENSRVYGAEAEVMVNFSAGRLNNTLTAGYTFMYPVEFNGVTGRNTGDYLKFRRKHSAELNFMAGYGRFEAGTNLSVKSRILEIDDVFLAPTTREAILPGFYDYWLEHNDGHLLVDFFAGYRFAEGYQVSLGIKNLTNTEYMGRPGDVMPHRYYSIQISGRF